MNNLNKFAEHKLLQEDKGKSLFFQSIWGKQRCMNTKYSQLVSLNSIGQYF